MTTPIRLRIIKDIDAATEKKILKLKGSLIIEGFTEIIHISDEGEDHYINSFVADSRPGALDFIAAYIIDAKLQDIVLVL